MNIQIQPETPETYRALLCELNRLSRSYYQHHVSEVSDAEYDAALKLLEVCEAEHPSWQLPDSPSLRVGAPVTGDLPDVIHEPRLYSLSNSYNQDELLAFDSRLRELLGEDPSYFCELKLDGVSLSLIYEKGLFVQAATRGDGFVGEDVTAQARTLRGLPMRLELENPPDRLVVRGEVVMRHDVFQAINRERLAEELKPLANPRNAAAGSLKQKDPRAVSKRGLDVFLYDMAVYDVPLGDIYPLITQKSQLDWMRKAGLPVFEGGHSYKNMQSVIADLPNFQEQRSFVPVDVDGVVIKLQYYFSRRKAGWTVKSPRWAIAYKFPAEIAKTRLLKIRLQVGRTGAVTPVADLEPVSLAGSVIARATLHNEEEIRRRGLREGLLVYVEKGGDVIPKVTGLAEEPGDLPPYEQPKECPSCGHPLLIDEDAVVRRCPNVACPAQLQAKLEHFVGRTAMDIEGMGTRLLEVLLDSGRLKDVADLYTLTLPELASLERMGDKSARNVRTSLDASLQANPERLLFALGIRHVGASVARALLHQFASISKLREASEEDLLAVEDVGPQVVLSLQAWFQMETSQDLMRRLSESGFDFSRVSPSALSSAFSSEGSPFSGKTVVLTGRFDRQSRSEIKADLLQWGARVSSSVSKKTDFLVAGREAGSKVKKAEDLGLTILDELAYFAMRDKVEEEKIEDQKESQTKGQTEKVRSILVDEESPLEPKATATKMTQAKQGDFLSD